MTLRSEYQISFARGAQDSAASTAYRQDECRSLQNFRVTTDGRAQLRNGSTRTHSSALNSGAQGYGGTQFVLANGTIQWVVFAGDKMYSSTNSGATNTQRATGLALDYWSTASMRISSTNYLLAANGNTNSYDWDGTTWGTISNIPSGIKFLAVMNDRLWASDGSGLYASKVADYDTWASASGGISLTMNTHEGDDPITGIFSSSIGLLVFKRRSTSYVQGYGNSDVITRSGPQALFRYIGCIAFRTIQGTGDGGVTWLSERGYEYWAPGMSLPILISAQMQSFFKDIAWKNINTTRGLPTAVWNPRHLSVECELPASGTQNNSTFVYRMPFGDKPGAPSRFTRSQTTTGDSYTIYEDGAGYLVVQTDTSQDKATLNDGYLGYAAALGSFVSLDSNDYLAIDSSTTGAAVMFLADTGDQANVVVSVGYDGFIRIHDTGSYDDVLSDGTGGSAIDGVLLCRPFVFGDPFMKKEVRKMRVLATNGTQTTVNVRVTTDTGATKDHLLQIRAGTSHPRACKVHAGIVGWDLGPEIRATSAGLLVSGVMVEAEEQVSE